MSGPTAIVAEDEGPQRKELVRMLKQLWPELTITAQCESGAEALEAMQHLTPNVAFLDNLRRENDPPVFDTVIRQANQIAAAAELETTRRTLKQKYGYGDLAVRYIDLARELLNRLEIDA